MWSQFWWVIFPYVMLTIFICGNIYRYSFDQLGWTAKSSEFLEQRQLRWGSILFHVGILCVFGGHVLGLLIPQIVTEGLGITETLYHTSAIVFGGLVGVITLAGLLMLLFRRVAIKRIRLTSSFTDLVIAVLLLVVIGMGVYNTLGHNLFVDGDFNYRTTIAPWLRGILFFAPDPTLMNNVPLFFRLHIIFAFSIVGLWPFTRLVHLWSIPWTYLKRSYIPYRSKVYR